VRVPIEDLQPLKRTLCIGKQYQLCKLIFYFQRKKKTKLLRSGTDTNIEKRQDG
jgi:hypothetical protein